MAIEKNQTPGSRFGATSYTALPIWPIWPNFEVNGLDWQCCLAGSSKTAPRIFFFSIVLGVECLSYLKSIETHHYGILPHNNKLLIVSNAMGAKYLSYVKSIATFAPTFYGYIISI